MKTKRNVNEPLPASGLFCLEWPGNWPEDFPGENGNYQNTCVHCGQPFIGHKRRTTCKVCKEAWDALWVKMTDQERAAHIEKEKAEVAEWMASRQNDEASAAKRSLR